MGIKRVVDTNFWSDPKVENFSADEKLFWIYLLTGPQSKQLGIYRLNLRYTVSDLGMDMQTCMELLRRFEQDHRMILFSPATGEVAILNYLQYSVVKGGIPLEKCILNEIDNVQDKSLVDRVFEHLLQKNVELKQTVLNVIACYNQNKATFVKETPNQAVCENANAVENKNKKTEECAHANASEKATVNAPASAQSVPAQAVCEERTGTVRKTAYGTYKNVFLTIEQATDLRQKLGSNWTHWVERLADYMHDKGKNYNDHYTVILRWAEADRQRAGSKTPSGTSAELSASAARSGIMNSPSAYDLEEAERKAREGVPVLRKRIL